ncbi:MAG: DUF935 family protein [Bryobacteraceae bacterium]
MASKSSKNNTAETSTREPRTSVIAGWSPAMIRSAELQCACGNYSLAADLCEAMMADERVSKCLNRLYAATTLPLAFQLPGLDAEKSKKDPICQALDADWWKTLPEQQMRTMVAWLGLFRCCLGHIDGWKRDEETGRVVPEISIWSPRNLRSDPVEGWKVRSTTGNDAYGTEDTVDPGDGNWIIIVAGSNYRAPYQAPWRGLSRWWLLKLYATIDWGSSSERHGQGQQYVSNTMSASGSAGDLQDTGESLTKDERRALASDLSEMGRNGVAVLPRGWKAELVTDGANTFATFTKQVDYANSAIDIGLTGTNLTTEVTGGSYAAASVHATVDSVVMSSLLELIATGIREQVLVFWVTFNFAAGIAPYPKWDTSPPEDKKANAEARLADAQALKGYVDAGAQIDQIAWFEGKVQLIKGATAEIKKPVAPAPAAPAPDPNAPPPGAPQPPAPPGKPEKQPPKKAALSELDIRMEAASASAFAVGREYTDRLEQECIGHAAKQLSPMVAAVLSAIEDAEDYDDAKRRIIEAFGDELPPTKLVKLTEAALILGQLAGRDTVDREVQAE